ncbi:hypothetical protein LZ30DRAFT_326692 [Colletotrichum cereale]|nr:hypothetical protein LZ30DRAFT_326692 [Colletotrichum cereale]
MPCPRVCRVGHSPSSSHHGKSTSPVRPLSPSVPRCQRPCCGDRFTCCRAARRRQLGHFPTNTRYGGETLEEARGRATPRRSRAHLSTQTPSTENRNHTSPTRPARAEQHMALPALEFVPSSRPFTSLSVRHEERAADILWKRNRYNPPPRSVLLWRQHSSSTGRPAPQYAGWQRQARPKDKKKAGGQET